MTFGGYVGLSSFLPLYLRAQHGVDAGSAGLLTALAAFAGSGARPFGGWLADRVGGARLLGLSLAGLALAYAGIATGPAFVPLICLLVLAMACCGCGNGAVFQLVPLRFRNQVGLATGVIGAIGGLGGFCLPMLLGLLRQHQGSFGLGFALLATVAMLVAGLLQALTLVRSGWRMSWRARITGVAEEA